MNVNGIGKQNYYEKTNSAKGNPKAGGSGFYESLSENLSEKAGAEQNKESAAVSKTAGAPAAAGYPYTGAASRAAGVYESENAAASVVSECEARGIIYQESDYMKVYAAEGFRLMAQVNVDKRSVYIERKNDDGTVNGYEVNMDKLDKDTTDPIGQAALEAWEAKISEEEADGEKELEELTFEEALLKFYEYIEDRIKNGPPKYLIGNSEYSIKEWDKLIEGVDGQLDAIKEELRERIEKMKEQMMKADAANELQSAQDDLQDAENEELEEKLLMSLFQDMGKQL
ncbi:MAG: hypothetical protein NC231_09015 [Bacillus sp. (in: Bacteria)]|nr:hypothetical protein [Bacillus sp. (in: firmicutes)]MCM1427567.1 hypothetical protein [Eubacterium sp.]